jgi:hypothetical protein
MDTSILRPVRQGVMIDADFAAEADVNARLEKLDKLFCSAADDICNRCGRSACNTGSGMLEQVVTALVATLGG